MKLLYRADFDFSNAAMYQKIIGLDKNKVKIADHEQYVETLIGDHHETSNIAVPGDYIITGNHGGRYIIAKETFGKLL